MAPSFDVCGWLAACPGVLRTVGSVLLQGSRHASPIARLVILDDAFDNAEPQVRALLHAGARRRWVCRRRSMYARPAMRSTTGARRSA